MGGAFTHRLGVFNPTGLYGTHSYWRIEFDDCQTGGSYIGAHEIEMRSTAGGADQCSGGTATASSEFSASLGADEAFDNVLTAGTGYWRSNSAANEWVQYQFTSAVEIVEIAIYPVNSARENTGKTGRLRYSDDGSSWTTAFEFVNDITVINSPSIHPENYATDYHRAWRMFFTDSNGGSAYTGVSEIELRATVSGADNIATLSADSSVDGYLESSGLYTGSSSKWRAFDDVAASANVVRLSGITNTWISIFTPSAITVAEVTVSCGTGSGFPSRMPKNMKLQYRDAGGSWTDFMTFTAETSWAENETRVLTEV